jgi:hypothetical protein
LLIVPFSNRWHRVTEVQRYVYFVAFLCAAAASAFLIAPSAYHRIRWREGNKEPLLTTGNRLAIVGIGFLAAGMTATVFLITDVLFGNEWAAVTTAIAAGGFAWLWFGLPLRGVPAQDRRESRKVDVPARDDADDLPRPGAS